jgi:hypothetical protein
MSTENKPKVFPEVPLEISDQEAYYWMDDHIEVACAHLDYLDGLSYNGKHSLCPSEAKDLSVSTPFGYFDISPNDAPFVRLKVKDVNPQFKATLLLLGINYGSTNTL